LVDDWLADRGGRLMAGKPHPWGCTCRTHVDRPWNRPEHWTQAEANYLADRFGQYSDDAIARRLGRTVVGVRLKAKRLGLHKRQQGLSARDVARIFGIDETTVSKAWVPRGLIKSSRPFYQGPNRIHLIQPERVERFIRQHPEWIDVEKMPPSPYRDLAARDPWISLPEAHRLTGRNTHAIANLIASGAIRGRRRGAHWYMPLADVGLIRPLSTPDAIEESWFRRETVLEMRRARRKGVAVRGRDRGTALPLLIGKVP
jgi:hypothetical protein